MKIIESYDVKIFKLEYNYVYWIDINNYIPTNIIKNTMEISVFNNLIRIMSNDDDEKKIIKYLLEKNPELNENKKGNEVQKHGFISNDSNNIKDSNIKDKNILENIDKELKITTESQGHGKPYEVEVLCVIGFCKEKILSYPHGSRYDGKKIDSLDERNKSVKTTGKNAPDCGDIKNFLTSEEMDIIVICYKQEGNYKIVKKTYVINFDSIKKVIKDDLTDKYDISDGDLRFEKWLQEIKKYIQIVIDVHEKTKITELNKIYNKKTLELPYFGIRPKTSQNRVQCELKLEGQKGILEKLVKDKDYFEEEGAKIGDKSFTSKIFAERRSRDGVTIKSLRNYCEKNGKIYPKGRKKELKEFVLKEFNIENDELLREELIKL